MNVVAAFPTEGYVVHGDLLGHGTQQAVVYNDTEAVVFASSPVDVNVSAAGHPLPQPKRLYSSTLYPGGEIV
ncbi:hypothetical protein D3C75_1122610 [compost metagenome]